MLGPGPVGSPQRGTWGDPAPARGYGHGAGPREQLEGWRCCCAWSLGVIPILVSPCALGTPSGPITALIGTGELSQGMPLAFCDIRQNGDTRQHRVEG